MWNLDLERITKGNWGLSGVFLAGVAGQLATEGAGVESMPGLRGGSTWGGGHGFGKMLVAFGPRVV